MKSHKSSKISLNKSKKEFTMMKISRIGEVLIKIALINRRIVSSCLLLNIGISGIVSFYLLLEIFDKQSSSTLQKSIHVYSIPKANRFGHGPKYAGEPSYYVETSFKNNSGRGTGFGFGNKRQFP